MSQNEIPYLKFGYSARLWMIIPGLLMFSCASYVFTHLAINNDRGLLINGIIHLNSIGASVLYASIGAISALYVPLGVLSAYRLIYNKNPKLSFYENHIFIPQIGLTPERKILYHSILAFYEIEMYGHRILEIQVNEGKVARISGTHLSKSEDFDRIVRELRLKTDSIEVGA